MEDIEEYSKNIAELVEGYNHKDFCAQAHSKNFDTPSAESKNEPRKFDIELSGFVSCFYSYTHFLMQSCKLHRG